MLIKKKCPKCGSRNSIQIIYGYPSHELAADEAKGKVLLGGCCVTGDDPDYRCKDCGCEWNRNRTGIYETGGEVFDIFNEVNIVHEALEFAALAHKGQMRKGTHIPYIVHPFEVALILAAENCDENVIIAGLLHDTVEDTDVSIDEVRSRFGEEVAYIVESCSEDKSLSWEARKSHTIEFLKEQKDRDVLMLSCADKLSNLRSINADYEKLGDKVWERFNRGGEQQMWYYGGLIEALKPLKGTSMYKELVSTFYSLFGERQ